MFFVAGHEFEGRVTEGASDSDGSKTKRILTVQTPTKEKKNKFFVKKVVKGTIFIPLNRLNLLFLRAIQRHRTTLCLR